MHLLRRCIALFFIVSSLVGCATLGPYNLIGLKSEIVKSWKDIKIYETISSGFGSHPESVFHNGLVVLRQEMVNRNPDWSEEIKKKIVNGEVSIGMTKKQVRSSLGLPNDINKTVLEYGVHEQWIYKGFGHQEVSYVYFDDGILTSWQD